MLRKFYRYREWIRDNAVIGGPGSSLVRRIGDRPERVFPLIAVLLTSIAVLGLLVLVVASIILDSVASETSSVNPWASFAEIDLNIAVLGFAFGLASILARYRYRELAIASLAVTSIPLVGCILIVLQP